MSADTVGGVWTYAIELADALGDLGIEVVLATLGKRLNGHQRLQAMALSNLTVLESDYKLEWMEDPWLDVERSGDWLLDLESWSAPDIVHLNGYAHGSLPWRKPVVVVGHSCVLSWWEAVHHSPAPPAWGRYRQAVTDGLHGADAIVAPTGAMLGCLQQHYGPLLHTCVIPNGRHLSAPEDPVKQDLVFSAGRFWDAAKNVRSLASVAHELSWPVYAAGDCPEDMETNPGFRRLGSLTSREMSDWLARAGIYALPALYEPFGLSVLEAALHSCALVLGDIPSLRENWDEAALFVPPADREALAAAIRRYIENGGLRMEYSRRARERARRFAPEIMARAYLNLYGELLASPELLPSTVENASA